MTILLLPPINTIINPIISTTSTVTSTTITNHYHHHHFRQDRTTTTSQQRHDHPDTRLSTTLNATAGARNMVAVCRCGTTVDNTARPSVTCPVLHCPALSRTTLPFPTLYPVPAFSCLALSSSVSPFPVSLCHFFSYPVYTLSSLPLCPLLSCSAHHSPDNHALPWPILSCLHPTLPCHALLYRTACLPTTSINTINTVPVCLVSRLLCRLLFFMLDSHLNLFHSPSAFTPKPVDSKTSNFATLSVIFHLPSLSSCIYFQSLHLSSLTGIHPSPPSFKFHPLPTQTPSITI